MLKYYCDYRGCRRELSQNSNDTLVPGRVLTSDIFMMINDSSEISYGQVNLCLPHYNDLREQLKAFFRDMN